MGFIFFHQNLIITLTAALPKLFVCARKWEFFRWWNEEEEIWELGILVGDFICSPFFIAMELGIFLIKKAFQTKFSSFSLQSLRISVFN